MEATLVQNIDSNADLGLYSPPLDLINADGTLFFQVARIPTLEIEHEVQLWTSDGTSEGTSPIILNSKLSRIDHLTSIGENLFFQGSDNLHGSELWSSDGTAEGSGLFLDINPRQFDQPNFDFTVTVKVGSGSNPNLLTDVDGTLFFIADDGINGEELWTSDGTPEGTHLVLPMVVTNEDGNTNSVDSHIANLINFEGKIFFTARDGRRGEELWMSDGTAEGTQLVRDINPFAHSNPRGLSVINETLYFTADNGVNGRELWVSDGTFEGTQLVRDINVGEESSNSNRLISVEDTIFFLADDGILGEELWISDGTFEGTQLVRDINVGEESSNSNRLINVEDTIFFLADNGIHGEELWVSDGTFEGTQLVRDINVGEDSSFNEDPKITNVDGNLFFIANDGVHGRELWTSDGTMQGTYMVEDINLGTASSFSEDSTLSRQSQLINANGTLFFTIGDIDQSELWRSDGTSEGTELVATGGNIFNWDLEIIDNSLFFTGESINGASEDASQLWKIELNSLGTSNNDILASGVEIQNSVY